jgi:MFS transporter, DHA1 family, inner membrane transport protein
MNVRILLLALGTFALGTDAFVVAGVLPKVAADLEISLETAGWVVTIFSLTYGLGAPFLAALTNRISRHTLLLGSLLVFTLANVLSALSPSFEALLLTRILAGVSAALYSPTAYTIATTLASPAKRGQALATVVAGLTISTVVGVPLGTWIGQSFNWRITFVLVAVLGGVALVVLKLVGVPRIPIMTNLSLQARLAPITRPQVLLALLPVMLWSLGTFVLYTYITPFLQYTTNIQDISGLLVAYGLGAVIGSWLAGLAVDKFGALPPIVAGLSVLTLTFIVLPYGASSLWGAFPLMFVWSLSGWSIFPPQQHRLLALFPESASVILALNNSVFYLGSALGSAVGGLVLVWGGTGALSWVGAVFEVLALGAFVLGAHPVRETSYTQKESELVATQAKS